MLTDWRPITEEQFFVVTEKVVHEVLVVDARTKDEALANARMATKGESRRVLHAVRAPAIDEPEARLMLRQRLRDNFEKQFD